MKEKIIYMAGGCFWGLDAYLRQIKGVLYTESGYANGKTDYTDYSHVKETDHTETVKVIYDDSLVSLKDLLSYYLRVVDPTSINKQGADKGRQYRTGIYFIDQDDENIINERLNKESLLYSKPIVIEVKPLKNYITAEEYHQNYLEKNPQGYCHIDLTRVREPLDE
ncbi:MAG: peptide-methionine (S)-S-oxide reductase MsrA [Eggerthia catenaformis]|uniref:peptide-methionine (S)-S-oxide reductase MsrA n=1 Tax=Eggerthia catenaformis TaxID=31973 RepID=UPI003FA17E59